MSITDTPFPDLLDARSQGIADERARILGELRELETRLLANAKTDAHSSSLDVAYAKGYLDSAQGLSTVIAKLKGENEQN